MRFMILLKANQDTEAGAMPTEQLLTAMGNYNEELVRAGVLVAGEGLQGTAKGARVNFSGDQRSVVNGPFPLSSDLLAGFWIFQVKSLEEAIDWVKKCPNPTGDKAQIEIRRIFEAEDFGDELTPELRAQEERLRAQSTARM